MEKTIQKLSIEGSQKKIRDKKEKKVREKNCTLRDDLGLKDGVGGRHEFATEVAAIIVPICCLASEKKETETAE